MTDREIKIRELSRAVRPAQAAPVRRDPVALNYRDGSAANGAHLSSNRNPFNPFPFAGDDAE